MIEAEPGIRLAPRRPLAATAILVSYLAAAVVMVVLCVRAEDVLSGESPSSVRTMRALFALAAVANIAIGSGGLRRARWARPLALGVHGLAATVALFGLATLVAGAPRLGTNGAELAAKGFVHALAAVLWSSGWMRRATTIPDRSTL